MSNNLHAIEDLWINTWIDSKIMANSWLVYGFMANDQMCSFLAFICLVWTTSTGNLRENVQQAFYCQTNCDQCNQRWNVLKQNSFEIIHLM